MHIEISKNKKKLLHIVYFTYDFYKRLLVSI